jgi:hypothetical protein
MVKLTTTHWFMESASIHVLRSNFFVFRRCSAWACWCNWAPRSLHAPSYSLALTNNVWHHTLQVRGVARIKGRCPPVCVRYMPSWCVVLCELQTRHSPGAVIMLSQGCVGLSIILSHAKCLLMLSIIKRKAAVVSISSSPSIGIMSWLWDGQYMYCTWGRRL